LGERSLTILGSSRSFLSGQEWVYTLSLLIPLIVYDLALKAAILVSIPGVAPSFYLMRSNVFFDLGYILLWLGLFAAAPRKGPVRRSVVVLFHTVTVLVVVVVTSSYQYFKLTGTAINYGVIALWLPDLKEVAPVLRSLALDTKYQQVAGME
jgi:lipoteichoic acid synthase